MKVTLRPLGDISDETMESLRDEVNCIFHCPVEVGEGFSHLSYAYDPERKQYLGSSLIVWLNALPRERDEKVVGITDVDLYAPRLNFIFGEADVTSGVVVVSLHRLKQTPYGLVPDKASFIQRATKEIVHELGHTFGLGHCFNPRCVMRFSNTLADTDYKEVNFCNECCPRIIYLV